MQRQIRFHPYILAAAVLVIVVLGPIAWQKWYGNHVVPSGGGGEGEFLMEVDRGIRPEDQPIFDARLATIQKNIAETEAAGKRDIHLYLQLGVAYYEVGKLGLATEQFLNILNTNPEDAPALENLGQARLEMKDYKGAEGYWRRAIAASPREDTYVRLANLLDDNFTGRDQEVRILLEQAVSALGQSTNLMIRLGNWYRDQGQLDEAISHYEVALTIAGGNKSIEIELNRLRDLREKELRKEQTK